MDTNELNIIKEQLDGHFVKEQDCTDRQLDIRNRLANDDKRLDLITRDVEAIKASISNVKKFGWGVLGTLAAQVILMLIQMAR